MTFESVRSSYRARADEYVAALGSVDHLAAPDLVLIRRWAGSLEGPVIDVGCGPGQWTHHLCCLGVAAEGIDPVAEFIDSARSTYPDGRYRVGHAEDLGAEAGRLGGVLAWYSLIHTAPDRISAPLAEFARCLRAGAGLALGFFTGPRVESFEHAITTAYYWPTDVLASEVESAGFALTHIETRTDPGRRPHGAILATR
ncbi:class I SAM-dependent methyltransferase [Nesterenkonia xinjiangensis]|uniref:SAM-dependent methyltransferase n=1 Tax=Nesterenkonia xinjiangensis TaxID=225327 RepID=A0A7Z0K9E5_9MICC|nr:class I SAM-dependent methyltransferase [Nesterenkonia xinjiangensis]NYJ78664.1 SAM-dependent methyltransferase [Nesterenkonia xinjiangensis]